MHQKKFAHAVIATCLLIIVLLLIGCETDLTRATDIPEVQFERGTHPNAKLLVLARDVPGFGGKFLDDQGRLHVYMLEPERVPATSKAALAEAFSVDEDNIVFVEGRYSVAQLAQWYYNDGVVSLTDHEEVVAAFLWGAQNRLAVFLEAFAWDEHHYSARPLEMDAEVERVQALLEEMGVPLDAVIIRLSGGLADDNWTYSGHILPPPRTSPYAWPKEHRMALDDETLVRFHWPHPALGAEPAANILHVPSGSGAGVIWVPEQDTFLARLSEDLGTKEGRAHVRAFLDDGAVMQRIERRIQQIWVHRFN